MTTTPTQMPEAHASPSVDASPSSQTVPFASGVGSKKHCPRWQTLACLHSGVVHVTVPQSAHRREMARRGQCQGLIAVYDNSKLARTHVPCASTGTTAHKIRVTHTHKVCVTCVIAVVVQTRNYEDPPEHTERGQQAQQPNETQRNRSALGAWWHPHDTLLPMLTTSPHQREEGGRRGSVKTHRRRQRDRRCNKRPNRAHGRSRH